MPLFEVAIIQQPTRKETEEGTGVEKLLFGPKAVLARDSQSALILAVTEELFEVHAATSDEVYRAMSTGVGVLDACAEVAPEAPIPDAAPVPFKAVG